MILKYCGAAICILACALILRGQKGEGALFISLGGGMILLLSAISDFAPVIDFLKETMGNSSFGEYFSLLLKAMGITLAVQFTSEICRDAGEGGIASKLELAGKVEMLILCLPLIKELVKLAADIMNQ